METLGSSRHVILTAVMVSRVCAHAKIDHTVPFSVWCLLHVTYTSMRA